MGGIDGQTERRVFVGDGARDIIVDPGGVAAHVELKHAQRVGRRLGDAFQAGIAHRREHVGDAELGRRLDHRRGALGMKAFQRADRAQHDRQPQLAPENFRRGVDLAHVTQHARAEGDRVERHAVAPQCRLGFDAADDVVPGVLVEILPGFVDDLVQVHEVRAGRQLRQCGGFVAFFAGHLLTCRSLRPAGRQGLAPCACKDGPARYRAAQSESRNRRGCTRREAGGGPARHYPAIAMRRSIEKDDFWRAMSHR